MQSAIQGLSIRGTEKRLLKILEQPITNHECHMSLRYEKPKQVAINCLLKILTEILWFARKNVPVVKISSIQLSILMELGKEPLFEKLSSLSPNTKAPSLSLRNRAFTDQAIITPRGYCCSQARIIQKIPMKPGK
jgi:hypothetical protein